MAMVGVVNFVSYFYRGYQYLGDGNLSFIRYILYIYIISFAIKKSYNLLAGMTEEELERIQENIEVKMKYDKGLKIIGYIFLIGGIVVLFLGLSYLFK